MKQQRRRLALVMCFHLLLIAGCAERTSLANSVPYSFEDRYPLSARAQIQRADVSAFTPTLSDTQRVAAMASEFRRSGNGKMVIFVPQSGAAALSSGNWVKQELVAQGVSPNAIQWDARPLPAGTVRLAFSTRAAQGFEPCSNLGEDIQQFENSTSYLNRETVNFGCAYQSNMRRQADNPNDFLRPRPEGYMDPVRTVRAIRDHRAGPSAQQATPDAGVGAGASTP